ncbi:sporulation inhibitor of replication protein SirA [Virgibacillus phasianinus]|uniref:sporulation inhibitor of replication protein SirA n=1 Tax=Virgibacillus phasianinus TaxID=2017483 RepID=UPI0012FE4384|nr:sporulation inhibitor of replication protein SirA [Virgibacillus phasianinus]
MNTYSIYPIKIEFARRYYYRSDILYRFLKQYHENNKNQLINDQFNEITCVFSTKELNTKIKSLYNKNAMVKDGNNSIEIVQDKHYISLHISEKQINFRCNMLQDAEMLLFPILQLFHPSLFVLDNKLNNYGWISPVTKLKDHLNEQILYSTL